MLELIVFLCGAVVMILEMVGSRILAPYLGSSIIVWTSLIGVILGSLSLGYWWGGVKADRDPNRRTLSRIILLSAVFIAGVAVAKSFVLDFLQARSINVRIASALATLILFAPPSVLLGMVTPYSVKLKLSSLEKSGDTVGRLFAISTLGSIIGTFAGGFYLISFFGSTMILYVLCLILVLASLAARAGRIVPKAACAALFLVLMAAANSYENYLSARGYHDVDTSYNRIIVYDAQGPTSGPLRVMTTHPRAMQSAMFLEHRDELVLPYTKFFETAFHFKPDASRFLVLGGGGYSFPKYLLKNHPNAAVDVVEIDAGVTDLARRFFFLEEGPRLRVTHEDARSALRAKEKYDVILIDVFNSHYSIPFHVTTIETARRIREKLVDDGVVIMNILSRIEGIEGRFLRAEHRTYKEVFEQVRLYPVSNPQDGSAWQNVMLVAMKSGKEIDFSGGGSPYGEFLSSLWQKPIPEDVPPLTDDFAPVDHYILTD